MRSLRLALLLLRSPRPARPGRPTRRSRSQDLPIGVARTTGRGGCAAALRPRRRSTGRAPARVLFRTRSVAGRWSAWQRAAPEGEDLPDPASREARARPGWHLGNPYWVGPSDRIAFRIVGDVRRLRAWYVWSPARSARRSARVSMAGSPQIVAARGVARERGDHARRRRATPAACYVRGRPPHGRHERVHGRASRRRSSAAIELYHVQGNGWNDIGYNFLVDQLRPGVRGPRRRDRAGT